MGTEYTPRPQECATVYWQNSAGAGLGGRKGHETPACF